MTSDGFLTDSEVELERAFKCVANDTRVDILRALWAVRTDGDGTTSFSELRDRVGVDDAGRFNYHLGKLVPEFVRKRDERYELTHTGAKLIGDAVSGAYAEPEATVTARTAAGTRRPRTATASSGSAATPATGFQTRSLRRQSSSTRRTRRTPPRPAVASPC